MKEIIKILSFICITLMVNVVNAQTVSTYAGNGQQGGAGVGGNALVASLSMPYGIATDENGNVYFSDQGNNAIKKIDKLTGIISVLITACAGPNPNIGERTTDVNWTSGNYKAAFDTAEIYAKNGEPWAQLRLGIFYYNGWGVKKDNKTALNWYKKAAAQTATGAWADGQIVGATGKTG